MGNEELIQWSSNHPRAIRSLVSKYTADEMLIDDVEQEVFYRLLNSKATFKSFSPYFAYCRKVVSELMDKHFQRANRFVEIEAAAYSTGIDYPDPDNMSNYYVRLLKSQHEGLLTKKEWRILSRLVKGERLKDFRIKEHTRIGKNTYIRLRKSIQRKLERTDIKMKGLREVQRMKEEGKTEKEIIELSGWSSGTLNRKLKYGSVQNSS